MVYIPQWIASFCGYAYEFLDRIFNLSVIELYLIQGMGLNFSCSISKAKNQLGFLTKVNFRKAAKELALTGAV